MGWIILGAGLLIAIWLACHFAMKIFRDGARTQVLARFPIFSALFYTFGVSLIPITGEWIQGELSPGEPAYYLGAAGIALAIGIVIWVIGFAYGRRRAVKCEGMIKI